MEDTRKKRVTAFVGSPRKRHTHQAVERFLESLRALGDVECEIVHLADYRIGNCRGCLRCFDKGEEFCPLKDDRDLLIDKMTSSDAIVLASPNYALSVSGLMKTFLDRLSFFFHRPRFFGKIATSIVSQGIYGGEKVVKYLDSVAPALGFEAVRGSCVTTREPISPEAQRQSDRVLEAHARRFHQRLAGPAYPSPTLSRLLIFRAARTTIRLGVDSRSRDHRYFREKGWFDSDYYYPTRLRLPKKAFGAAVDWLTGRLCKHKHASPQQTTMCEEKDPCGT